MPRLKSSKKARASHPSTRGFHPGKTNSQEKAAPVKGVKLKTVSAFTMIFAMLCLGAFLAGRPPISSADAAPTDAIQIKERPMFLGLRTVTYDVQDLEKAKDWYGKVLGIQPYFDQPFYAGFNVGGYELGLVPEAKAEHERKPAGIAYWGVEDARAAYRHLVELGATVQTGVQDVGDGILVGTVRDPFGNVLGVIQNPHFKLEGS